MMKVVILFLCILCAVNATEETEKGEKKHFYFMPIYHKSHWFPQVEIAKELHKRGHQITFQLASEFEESGENPKHELLDFANIRIAPIGFTPEDMQAISFAISEIAADDYLGLITNVLTLLDQITSGWVLSMDYLLSIIESGEKIDVIVSDHNPGIATICYVMEDIDCIWTSPFIIRYPDHEYTILGKDVLPKWFPLNSLGKGLANSLSERITLQLTNFFGKIFHYFIEPFMLSHIKQAAINRFPNIDIDKALRKIYPTLINSFQGFDWNVPIPPHVKYIGPLNLDYIESSRDNLLKQHNSVTTGITSREELKEIDRYLEDHNNIIVISFGKTVELSTRQALALVEFARISKHPVLWSIRERQLHLLDEVDLPDNLRLETWVNLIEILSHPHTNILISQCGVATAHEAILTHVPLLCIPMLFDQFEITVLVEYHELGERVAKEDMSGNVIHEKVEEMLEKTNVYIDNAKKLTKFAELKPPLTQIIDWIEVVSDLGVNSVLPPIHGRELYFYEYHELFILFLLTTFLSIYPCYKCCFYCCRKKNRVNPKKKKTE